jgi:hypothetical protein
MVYSASAGKPCGAGQMGRGGGIGVNLIAAPDMTQVDLGAVYPVSVKVSPASTLRLMHFL